MGFRAALQVASLIFDQKKYHQIVTFITKGTSKSDTSEIGNAESSAAKNPCGLTFLALKRLSELYSCDPVISGTNFWY